ncbi:DUF982 domain-containing protein [Gellertiella hungarica]|uniref:DUF982 domain-containing protein n=1 Tax=Gellertiella hungarica TaxID=1572859 RepID=A0A7W6J6E6_9HYPH|nr:DUF982 domain-containing protein [Gellertiella hungarica]MBB4064847.1 hypothetical protein [Gellertiella hungarica]
MTFIEMPFDQPFRIELQGGLERIFLNAYDALDFLENEWPIRTGLFYERAIAACRDALEGRGTCRAARAALMLACREAGLRPASTRRAPLAGPRKAA